jgi:hypothetical protein
VTVPNNPAGDISTAEGVTLEEKYPEGNAIVMPLPVGKRPPAEVLNEKDN